MKELTMGSLFDGSGGFPLICQRLGIEPLWASEVEPFPIKVTRKRFPNMEHLGDISKVKGNRIKKVKAIFGGSPCQSLSQAGKRDGLSKKCLECGHLVQATEESDICPICGGTMAYTRSGLFMEQLRIVKEMREDDEASGRTDKSVRPRFMVWENVPGALSSPGKGNSGEDFRVVLEEIARVKDRTATIPRPPKGKWEKSGCIMGDGYSIAWRVLDAQYWGVPQKRSRIALVADFGGQSAPEILFVREGLSGDIQTSGCQREKVAGCFTESIDKTGQYTVDFGRTADRIQMNADKSVTLLGLGGGGGAKTGLYCLPVTMQVRCGSAGGEKGVLLQHDKTATLSTINSFQTLFAPKVFKISPYHSNAMMSGNPESGIFETDKSNCLSTNGADPCCNQGGLLICMPVYAMDRASYNMGKNAQYDMVVNEDKAPCMIAKGPGVVVSPEVYTTAKARHMVEVTTDKAYTLTATDWKDAPMVYVPVGDFEEITEEEYKAAVEKGEYGMMFPVYASSGNYFFTKATEDRADTLLQRDYKDAPIVYVPRMTASGKDKVNTICASASTKLFLGNQEAFSGDYYIAEPVYEPFETVALEGNGQRPSHKGDGFAVTDKMYTLNTVEKHAVAYVRFIPEYEIRRLTPDEERKLQGFPEGWTDGLEDDDPTDEEMEFWKGVFKTHWELGISGTKKPKTEKEIRKWLASEPNDQALYKMWGNGIALPPFQYVVEGIKAEIEKE